MRRFLAKPFLWIHDALDRGRRSERLAKLERFYRDQNSDAKSSCEPPPPFEPYRFRVAPDWTPDDIANLRKFISTASGQALILRLNAMVATVAIAGCNDPMHTTHSAGIGAGWDECVKKLIEHSQISRVTGDQVTTNETSPGEEELLARFSP